jgi:hypothetical protein
MVEHLRLNHDRMRSGPYRSMVDPCGLWNGPFRSQSGLPRAPRLPGNLRMSPMSLPLISYPVDAQKLARARTDTGVPPRPRSAPRNGPFMTLPRFVATEQPRA